MLRKPLLITTFGILTIGVIITSFSLPQGTQGAGDQVQPHERYLTGDETNPLLCEPLVIFDSSGTTLMGVVHRNLSVYNNGQIAYAEFTASPRQSRNEMKFVSAQQAEMLRDQLVAAGAMTLIDQQHLITDVPLNTVTVFQGGTDATAHTFSYWGASGQFDKVKEVIEHFITQQFPALSR